MMDSCNKFELATPQSKYALYKTSTPFTYTWERLYGSFYMEASIWELLYGSFYMRACTMRYQCVTNALLMRYSVRYPNALPPLRYLKRNTSFLKHLHGSFYMGQHSTQRRQQSTYGSLYMGACIWERLYGSFYMGASIYEAAINTSTWVSYRERIK